MIYKTIDDPNVFGGKKLDSDRGLSFAQNIKEQFYATPTPQELESLKAYIIDLKAAGDISLLTGEELENTNTKIKALHNNLSTDRLKAYVSTTDAATQSEKNFGLFLNKSTIAANVTRGAVVALNAAKNMLIGFGIGLALQAIVSGITAVVQAQDNAIKKADELTSAYKDSKSEIDSNIKSLKSLEDEFTKLSKGVDESGKNISLTATEYDKYRSIISQVIEMNPSLIKGYNNEGQALVNNNTLISEAITLQKELNSEKQKTYLASGDDILKGSRAKEGKATNEIGSIINSNAIGGLGEALVGGWEFGSEKLNKTKAILSEFGIEYNDILNDNMSALELLSDKRLSIVDALQKEGVLDDEKAQSVHNQIALLDVQISKIKEAQSETSNFLSYWAASDEGNKDWFGKIDTKYLSDFNSSLGSISSNKDLSLVEMQVQTKELATAFIEIQDNIPIKEFEYLQECFRSGSITEDEYKSSVIELLKTLETLNTIFPELSTVLDNVSNSWRGTNESILEEPFTSALLSTAELSKVLSDTENSLSSLAGAYKEQDEAGKLSNSTLLTLMENHENWVDLVTIENGVIKLNKDAVLDKANATIQAKIDELEATKLTTTESISLMRNEMQTLISLAKTYTSVSQIIQAEKALMSFKGDIDNLELSLLETDKIIDVLRGSLNQLGTSDPFGNLADNAKNLNDELEDAIKKEESMLKAYGEAAIASIDKRIAAKRKEIEAINEQYEAEDDLMRLQQARDAYENAKAQKNTRVFYEDKGWVWEADQTKVDEAKDALKEIEREIAKKEAINAIEDEIDSLENLKDKYKEAMDKIGMDIDEHNMQMQYMADFENGVFQTSIANMEAYVQRIEELMARAAAARANGMGASGLEKPSSSSDKKTTSTSSNKKMSSTYTGYATGTNFVPKTGIYNIDEQGKEIIIKNPRYGRLQLLEYGSSVIPANISQRLIELGSISPDKLFKDINLNLFSPNYQANQAQPQQNVTHITIDKIVTDAKSFPEFLSDIQRMSRVSKPI